jgi:hypothetical protein
MDRDTDGQEQRHRRTERETGTQTNREATGIGTHSDRDTDGQGKGHRNFILISKMQTCLSDKMHPKKGKIKKSFSKIAKSHFFSFFILTFLGAFCH